MTETSSLMWYVAGAAMHGFGYGFGDGYYHGCGYHYGYSNGYGHGRGYGFDCDGGYDFYERGDGDSVYWTVSDAILF